MKKTLLKRLTSLCATVALSAAVLAVPSYAEAGEMQPDGFGGFYTKEVQDNVTTYMSYDANLVYSGKQILTENPETKMSVLEGYDTDGNLVQRGTYDGNTGMGETMYYQTDGTLTGRQEYCYDLNTQTSKTVILYNAEGMKVEEGTYDGDTGRGEETYYDDGGAMAGRTTYAYDGNGGMQMSLYDANNVLGMEYFYDTVAGVQTVRNYSETGVLVSEMILNTNAGTGTMSYYDESGTKAYQGECSFNLESGEMNSKVYNMNGVLVQEQHSNTKTGEREATYYQEDGSVQGVQKVVRDPATGELTQELYDGAGNRIG